MKVDLEMIELFEELESIVKNASPVMPFSQRCGIDKEEILDIIQSIKTLIPEEVTQAVWINKERQKIINKANKEAEEIVAQAQKEAELMKNEYTHKADELKKNSEEVVKAYVEASEPVAQAEEKADEIIQRAERIANEIRLGSVEYADSLLSSVEYSVQEVLAEISRNRKELNIEN